MTMVFGALAPLQAQEQAWVQVEAVPTLREGQERARAYGLGMENVAGFQLGNGWYALALGPFAPAEAAGELANLKRQGLIPRDSYITDGSSYGQQFWPVGQNVAPAVEPALPEAEAVIEAPAPALESALEPTPEPAVEPTTEPAVEPQETLREARAAEAALSRDERMELQQALAWYGFYTSSIDGAFGPGTRNSMADWQEALGYDPTGVLTTAQRGTLIANHRADLAEFGFENVTESEAGIEITLPLSLVQFDHYEPPFVHFSEKNASGMQIILISEPGDKAALYGLYDILQTLEVVPAAGERSRDEKSFTINAASDKVQSFAYAEAGKGAVKGYLVVWKPADAARMERILPALKASFRSLGDKALDPGLVPLDEAARAGLLSGLEVKVPKLSRSGFYADAIGDVVTSVEAVQQCGRITLDGDTEATVLAQDATSGIAILRPSQALAPKAYAQFQSAAPRLGSEIAVAGYSYEGKLPAAVLTFGTLAENAGLNGEAGVSRLAAPVLPGDAGGPVLDATGAVVGMLMPMAKGGAKLLPEGVAFAAQSSVITQALTSAGIAASSVTSGDLATPDALSAAGVGMTVLVSCWE
jgi:S1-C subfamily serine protease